jgi:hypothetical protein
MEPSLEPARCPSTGHQRSRSAETPSRCRLSQAAVISESSIVSFSPRKTMRNSSLRLLIASLLGTRTLSPCKALLRFRIARSSSRRMVSQSNLTSSAILSNKLSMRIAQASFASHASGKRVHHSVCMLGARILMMDYDGLSKNGQQAGSCIYRSIHWSKRELRLVSATLR